MPITAAAVQFTLLLRQVIRQTSSEKLGENYMTLFMYAPAIAVGLALGWFAYDIARVAFIAVMERRRYALSRVNTEAGRDSAIRALRHPKALKPQLTAKVS